MNNIFNIYISNFDSKRRNVRENKSIDIYIDTYFRLISRPLVLDKNNTRTRAHLARQCTYPGEQLLRVVLPKRKVFPAKP